MNTDRKRIKKSSTGFYIRQMVLRYNICEACVTVVMRGNEDDSPDCNQSQLDIIAPNRPQETPRDRVDGLVNMARLLICMCRSTNSAQLRFSRVSSHLKRQCRAWGGWIVRAREGEKDITRAVSMNKETNHCLNNKFFTATANCSRNQLYGPSS